MSNKDSDSLSALAAVVMAGGLYMADNLRKGILKENVESGSEKQYQLLIFDSTFMYLHLACRTVQMHSDPETSFKAFDYLAQKVVLGLVSEYNISDSHAKILLKMLGKADQEYGQMRRIIPTYDDNGIPSRGDSCTGLLAEKIDKLYDYGMYILLMPFIDIQVSVAYKDADFEKVVSSSIPELEKL